MTDLTRLTAALADRYVIEGELGAGGMATVYLAHDVRHDRKVALKVLRPELSAILGGERFLAEIKTTANLQHPHILSLFDSGEADGLVYYVMPYVEGESLRDRLTREKQLPVDEAVRIAREVADALEYAHEQGVIHRDIKPENVLLHGGHALVADFGIALAASRSDGATRMTETGMSLGTPAYMSPEQAMGEKEITPKADIYALGAVLYEMLSGEPPFVGPTAQAIIARVMTEDPRALTLHRHTVPPHVEAAVLRALEKLPADRFATAAEFRAALANPAFTTVGATSGLSTPPARRGVAMKTWAPWLLAAAGLAVAAGALLRGGAEPPVIRYHLALPLGQAPDVNRRAVPSPDGSHILFVGPVPGSTRGETQLWLKPRDAHQATPLTGTTGAWNATFSPDGTWVAFIQEGRLKKIPINGGAPITLVDSAATGRAGIVWLDDGTIVYIQIGGGALRRVAAAGGPATVVLRTDTLRVADLSPLPDARGVLIARCATAPCPDLAVWGLDLRSGELRHIVASAGMAQYLPTGHLVYVSTNGSAFAARFDLGDMRLIGPPVPVFDSVAVTVAPLLQVSRSGTAVVRTGAGLGIGVAYEMVWVDRAGRATPIDMGDGSLNIDPWGGNPGWSLSPDGRRLAIGLATSAGGDVWVKELPAGPLSRVTFDSGPELRPRWMPGGRALSFVAARPGGLELHSVPAGGTGTETVLARHPVSIFEGAVSPDGRWIVTRVRGGIGRQGRDIIGFRAGDTTAVPLIVTQFDENAFALSPDGRWIAYESDETGRREVYIRPFPGTDAGKWQASTAGGFAPLWARNGRELFFVDEARRMTAVSFAPGPEPRLGERRPLFALTSDLYLWENDYYTPWDISPDGQRFLMARLLRSGQVEVMPHVVVENWFTELRRRMAGR